MGEGGGGVGEVEGDEVGLERGGSGVGREVGEVEVVEMHVGE